MAKPLTDLEFRTPLITWTLTASLVTLCLHGLIWFLFSAIFGLDQAVLQTRQLMVTALFWIICVQALWRLNLPRTRLHAVLNILTCVFFVAFMGTVVALVNMMLRGAVMSQALMTSFWILGAALIAAQLILAVPSAILLQMLALRRQPLDAPQSAPSSPDGAE